MNPGQAKGIFLQTSLGDYAKVLLSRIALSKLYGTANYNSIEDPLLTNPFWARDAIYATPIRTKTFADMVRFTINAGVILDEEADVRDPDAPGSVNTIDERDAVTAVAARFFGVNTSLTAELVGFDAGDGVQRHRLGLACEQSRHLPLMDEPAAQHQPVFCSAVEQSDRGTGGGHGQRGRLHLAQNRGLPADKPLREPRLHRDVG